MTVVRLAAVELVRDAEQELPSEFRILRHGVNTTTKGDVLFDDTAAEKLMAAYTQHGVDVMIDLEHLSLDAGAQNFDPDARGWCKLAVRDGELWAVEVRWGKDGAERLGALRQRYVSPVLELDEDRRAVAVINIALTALPATDNAQPLMAASRRRATRATRYTMTDEEKKKEEMRARRLSKLRALMALPDDATADDVVAALEELPTADVLEIVLEAIADVADEVADDAPSDDADIAMAARKLAGAQAAPLVIARLSALAATSGTASQQAARIAALEAREAARELDDAIRLNANRLDPSTEKSARALAARYGVDAAREFVAALPERAVTQPPAAAAPQLSESALRLCAERKIDPAVFAATRAAMRRGAV